MHAKILIALILFALLGSFAQAGVITGIDWDQVGMDASVQHDPSPAEEPIHFDRGEQPDNGISAPSVSVSTSATSGILSTLGLFAPASIAGTIVDSDLSPPMPPLLDGIIRPA